MLKRLIYVPILILIAISCKEKKDKDLNQTETEPVQYFPVYAFLKGEIKKVDEMPGGIKKIISNGDAVDSSYISHDEFHQLTAEFLTEELEARKFEEEFTERKFYDQSIASSSFIYEATNSKPGIKRIDVITKTSDIYEEVVSMFIEKTNQGTDTISRLLWHPGKEFQLYISTPETKDHPIAIRVVWDQFGGK